MTNAKNETTFSHEDMEQMRESVRSIMEAEGKNQADIARETGVKYGTFTGWLAGTYQGNNDRVAGEVQIWLSAREDKKRHSARVPRVPGFQRTESAESFLDCLSFAQIMPEISVIAGGAGIGKTSAITYYGQHNPNVWIATMDPSTASIHAMLSELCDVMDIPEKSPTKLARAISRKVEGSGGLIIVDEAQHLDAKALDQLRSIYDRANGSVGIALVGNESVYSRLDGQGRKASFAQLFSRIGVRITQSKPKPNDMCLLIKAWGVDNEEEIKLLKAIGRKPGALRQMTKTIQLASMLAAGAEEERTIKHIKAAWERLSASSQAA